MITTATCYVVRCIACPETSPPAYTREQAVSIAQSAGWRVAVVGADSLCPDCLREQEGDGTGLYGESIQEALRVHRRLWPDGVRV